MAGGRSNWNQAIDVGAADLFRLAKKPGPLAEVADEELKAALGAETGQWKVFSDAVSRGRRVGGLGDVAARRAWLQGTRETLGNLAWTMGVIDVGPCRTVDEFDRLKRDGMGRYRQIVALWTGGTRAQRPTGPDASTPPTDEQAAGGPGAASNPWDDHQFVADDVRFLFQVGWAQHRPLAGRAQSVEARTRAFLH